jgi:hypothetical protein
LGPDETEADARPAARRDYELARAQGFCALLNFHFKRGTRPGFGPPMPMGLPWTNKDLAGRCGVGDRTIRNWLNSESVPVRAKGHFALLETAFFDKPPNTGVDPFEQPFQAPPITWRSDFRRAHDEAAAAKAGQLTNETSSVELDDRRNLSILNFGIARVARRVTRQFIDEYLVSETGEVPFGGRDAELGRLDHWLSDPNASPRMLITAQAGRGKSALLVRWLQSLRELGQVEKETWQLAFMPISIRAGTNKPSVFLSGLAQRLAEIIEQPVPPEAIQNPEALQYIVHDQIEALKSSRKRVLIVLDGLDETLQGSFDASIIPIRLSGNIRVLFSARWQTGDKDSAGWLRRLEWDRGVRVTTLELGRLLADGIADVLRRLGAPTYVLAGERTIIARLSELTEGEPLLVRYYAQDLWDFSQKQARITIDDLGTLKPGFDSYFQRWLEHQEKLWAEEGQSIDRTEMDRVLSVLAFALGPLESSDLLSLVDEIHGTGSLISEHYVLLSISVRSGPRIGIQKGPPFSTF